MTDLEDLRAGWLAADRRLSAALERQSALLLQALIEPRLEKLHRAGAMRGVDLVIWVAFLAGFGWVLAHTFGQWRFFIPALALQIWTVIAGLVTFREREALRAVDFAGPPAAVQQRLAYLRLGRARSFWWALLTGQLLWWIPFVIVVARGVFGLDLWGLSPFMHRFIVINLAVGGALIPFGWALARVFGPRLTRSRAGHWLIDSLSGRDMAEARALASRLAAFASDPS